MGRLRKKSLQEKDWHKGRVKSRLNLELRDHLLGAVSNHSSSALPSCSGSKSGGIIILEKLLKSTANESDIYPRGTLVCDLLSVGMHRAVQFTNTVAKET